VDHAKLVIEAAEEGERNGLGVVSLNGKMIDARLLTTRGAGTCRGVRRASVRTEQ
jgi:citrate lyase beta subunit